jgi:hypothetical protein
MSDHHPTQSDLTPPCPFCWGKNLGFTIHEREVGLVCLTCGAAGGPEEVLGDTEQQLHDAIMRAAWKWARRAR